VKDFLGVSLLYPTARLLDEWLKTRYWGHTMNDLALPMTQSVLCVDSRGIFSSLSLVQIPQQLDPNLLRYIQPQSRVRTNLAVGEGGDAQ
jgi:hypothetical protein